MLGDDRHPLRHQVGGVETHAELTDHRDVCSSLQGLHEGLGARLGDGSQVVDKVGLGHADAGVDQGEGASAQVGSNFNLQLLAGLKSGGVRQAFISDFVQGLPEWNTKVK